MRLRYFFICIISSCVMAMSQYLIYLSFHTLGIFNDLYIEKILLLAGMVFPVVFMLAIFYRQNHFSILNSCIYTAGALWFGIVFYLFVVAFLVAILILIDQYLNLILPIRTITISLISFALGSMAYGAYNAKTPKIVRWEVKSEKLAKLWKGKKIIFISDAHLGNIRREKFTKKIVSIINK